MVARLEAPRADDRGSGSRCAGCAGRRVIRLGTGSRRHRHRARQSSQTDRHRPLQVQAGRPGLPALRTSHLHLSLRRRSENARTLVERHRRRSGAVMVSGRRADRLHEQPRARSGSRGGVAAVRHGREAGRNRAGIVAGDEPRRPQQSGMEPRRQVDRIPRRRREEVRRIRHGAPRHCPRGRVDAAETRGGERGARPRRVTAAMGRGWPDHLRHRDRRYVSLRRTYSG